MKLNIECSEMRTGWSARPGKHNFILESCQLRDMDEKDQRELLAQIDFDLIAEYVDSTRRVSDVA